MKHLSGETHEQANLCRLILPLGLVASLVLSNQFVLSASQPVNSDLNLKSEAKLRNEAALYDTAIREIGQLSNRKLSNPDESKAAQAILQKQIPNLSFIRSKLIVLGLSESSLISAARPRASDTNHAREFALELAKNPNSIFQLSGAQSLKDKIRRTVESDSATLRKVGEELKQAGNDIKANAKLNHSPHISRTVSISNSASPYPANARLTDTVIANYAILAVCIAFPVVGIALTVIAANAIGVAIGEQVVSFAVSLVLFVKQNASDTTEKQKDDIQACEDRAGAQAQRCIDAAETLIIPLNYAALDLCYGAELFDLALCLTI